MSARHSWEDDVGPEWESGEEDGPNLNDEDEVDPETVSAALAGSYLADMLIDLKQMGKISAKQC
eukprot:9223441-Alexandrium_andersonii.AAC.1